MDSANNTPTEFAFYYPGHLWRSAEWIKTLLLFFDGIALLVPEYKQDEPELLDPHLAVPLREQGLLHYLIADETVNKEVTSRLGAAIFELIDQGALDKLAKDGTGFHELSMSRMGFHGDSDVAMKIFDQLAARGLAGESRDGVSIPLHRDVRYLILVLLAQIIRSYRSPSEFELSPTTDIAHVVRALTEVLGVPTVASAGNVIAFDLQSVSVNLRGVPLDEVLSYRKENLAAHRLYSRSVRQFAREVSLLPENERAGAFADRQSQLDDLASDLRRRSRAVWKLPASFALSLAGAAWSLYSGNPVASVLSAGAALLKGPGSAKSEAGAFSYLFAAHDRYS